SLELTGEMIAEDLRRFIGAEMPWDSQQATIDVQALQQGFVVPEGDLTMQWSANPQYRWVGPGVFRAEISVDGEPKRSLTCRASVEAYADVLVAATDIPRGRIISPDDLQLEKRAMSRFRHGVLTDPAQAVGKLARSTIFPGAVLTKRQVVPRKLVRRYQTVTVEARTGALVVRGLARAMSDGAAGDMIVCMNPGSKEEFIGVIRKDGIVVVE
ncbi:unnamed protein product, partial [marine sediment metagenome]